MHNVYEFLEQEELFIVRSVACSDEYGGEIGTSKLRFHHFLCGRAMVDKKIYAL